MVPIWVDWIQLIKGWVQTAQAKPGPMTLIYGRASEMHLLPTSKGPVAQAQ